MPRSRPPSDPSPGREGLHAAQLAQFSRVDLLSECRRRFGTEFAFLSTEQLMDEVRRRSLGCLLIALQAGEGNTDLWPVQLKGSPALLGLAHLKLELAIHEHLRAQCREGGA